jgi:SAM-dependent methyltransferase
LTGKPPHGVAAGADDYQSRVAQQVEQYRDEEIHDLPGIYHYWSNKHLGPVIEQTFGPGSIPEIYAREFASAIERTGRTSLVSLGAGDGATEVEIAKALRAMEVRDFSIELVELSDHLLGRAAESAMQAGVADGLRFTQTDVNKWRPTGTYAGVMANHSLHHFVELESVFEAVWKGLDPTGVFVSFDMIGRNGHQRWPEARLFTQFLWDQLPERYKFHRLLNRLESPLFMDWDCSTEGFEGIRAQDILPLLTQRFGFAKFAAWGGLIDVFVDRGFGPNFDGESPTDQAFIDRAQAANEALLQIGFLKPTQMAAVMVKNRATTCQSSRGLDPWRCIRDPTFDLAPWTGALETAANRRAEPEPRMPPASIPLIGYGLASDVSDAPFEDGWMGSRIAFRVNPRRRITGLRVNGWNAEGLAESVELTIDVADQRASKLVGGGLFGLDLVLRTPLGAPVDVAIRASPVRMASETDHRLVSVRLDTIELLH